jgi:hypothetical protein
MKKIFLLIIVALALYSCGEKNNAGTIVVPDLDELGKYSYSSLTPEKQKEKLTEDARAVLNELKPVRDCDVFRVIKTFNELSRNAVSGGGGSQTRATTITGTKEVWRLADYYGKFTWNSNTNEWEQEEATDRLEWNFPVGNQAATIVVKAVSSGVLKPFYEYVYDWDREEYEWIEYRNENEVELPKEVSGVATLGGKQVGNIIMKSEIVSATKAPRLTEVNITFSDYALTSKMSGSSDVAFTTSLTHSGKTVIDAQVDASLNLDDYFNAIGDENEEPNVPEKLETVIAFGSDLAFAGTIQYAKAEAAADAAVRQWDIDYAKYGWLIAEENYTQAGVDAFNNYCELYLVSISDKTRIASLKSRMVANRIEGIDVNGDGTFTDDDEWYEYTDTPVLVFNDDTEIEASVYFSEGFDSFIREWEDFIASFQ